MKKILQISDPLIKGYPDYACHLAMIPKESYFEDWMYCNFIQLFFNPKESENMIRYYYVDTNGRTWHTRSPIFEQQIIHKDVLQALDVKIIDFIIKMIDLNYYCDLYVDLYYMTQSTFYNQEHFNHSIFIYGYDIEEKKIYTIGYDKSMKYSYNTVDFDEFAEAYNRCVRETHEDRNMINLYFLNPYKERYEFDIDAIIDQIKDYIGSVDTQKRFRMNFNPIPSYCFGLDCIDKMVEVLEHQSKDSQTKFNYKPYAIFWEHKKFMIDRIEYLIKKGYLNEDCKSIKGFQILESEYRKILNRAIKYYYKRDHSSIIKMIEALKAIRLREKPYWEILQKEIEESRID